MSCEFPTLRLMAAVVDNGCGDTTPGKLSIALEKAGHNLDSGLDRYSCAKLMSAGWTDDFYSDTAWLHAVTVTKALHSHHGYVILEGEDLSYIFQCHGRDATPQRVIAFSVCRGEIEIYAPCEGVWGGATDDESHLTAPWSLVVHDELAHH